MSGRRNGHADDDYDNDVADAGECEEEEEAADDLVLTALDPLVQGR